MIYALENLKQIVSKATFNLLKKKIEKKKTMKNNIFLVSSHEHLRFEHRSCNFQNIIMLKTLELSADIE